MLAANVKNPFGLFLSQQREDVDHRISRIHQYISFYWSNIAPSFEGFCWFLCRFQPRGWQQLAHKIKVVLEWPNLPVSLLANAWNNWERIFDSNFSSYCSTFFCTFLNSPTPSNKRRLDPILEISSAILMMLQKIQIWISSPFDSHWN